ncbi:enolase-phosphatase e1-like protein [Dermatophagoides farinae]|uniref:Enolase-phosphatase e1-like protein n=1 Tax=Dermatophagoides farinae TaxID=6954 RepID=A0A9D4P3G9_DERFA|nr:enolase-phosphatase e1-like protein [Dermatophagoides farinae]
MHENWNTKQVRMDLEQLRLESELDPNAPKMLPLIDDDNSNNNNNNNNNNDNDIDTAFDYVRYCLDNRKENKAMTLLRFHMWFDGYAKNRLETPVYSDVAIQIQKWRCDQDIKLYVFSNGWSEATRRFMMKTNHGDLNLLIDGYFDTSLGQLNDPDTFRKMLQRINEKPENVMFLTKSPEEGRAAESIGLTVVLVLTHRRNIERLDDDGRRMARVRSFNELEFE